MIVSADKAYTFAQNRSVTAHAQLIKAGIKGPGKCASSPNHNVPSILVTISHLEVIVWQLVDWFLATCLSTEIFYFSNFPVP